MRGMEREHRWDGTPSIQPHSSAPSSHQPGPTRGTRRFGEHPGELAHGDKGGCKAAGTLTCAQTSLSAHREPSASLPEPQSSSQITSGEEEQRSSEPATAAGDAESRLAGL